MLDFDPPAALDWVDLSDNQISKIENVSKNPYLRQVFLDKNKIQTIENLIENTHLRVLSLNQNQIKKIENIQGINLEELYLADNQLTKI